MTVRTVEERFWPKVSKGAGCWEWTGARKPNGYGNFLFRGSTWMAHRVSWVLSRGEIPAGMLVDHLCFNHACVNPSHLRLVTQKQNQEHRRDNRADNTSGFRGVSWQANRWTAYASHNGRYIRAGRYTTREEANAAAIALRNELFTHNDTDRKASA